MKWNELMAVNAASGASVASTATSAASTMSVGVMVVVSGVHGCRVGDGGPRPDHLLVDVLWGACSGGRRRIRITHIEVR